MRRLTVPVLILLALVSAIAGLAACGGGNDDAQKVLKETFGNGKSVKSGKLDVAINFQGKGSSSATQQPVALRLQGPFQSQGKGLVPKFDLSAAIGGGGASKTVGALSTGQQGFLTVGQTAYVLPPSIFNRFKQGFQQSQKQNNGKPKTTLGALGIQPLDWLKDPKLENDETIGGVDTKHVSAGVDVPKFLDDVNKVISKARTQTGAQGSQLPSQGITPAQRTQIADSVKNARFDVWSGKDDKILRKLAVSLDYDRKSGSTAPSALTSGSLDFSVTLTDLNKPQTITAPVGAKPFAQLQSQIQGLLGQLQGAGGGGGTGGGGGSAPGSGSGSGGSGGSGGSPTGNQAYVNCIAKAGGDIAKAQKCADLLNP
jgi:hypothetical protein